MLKRLIKTLSTCLVFSAIKTLTFPSISPLYISNTTEQQQHEMVQVYPSFADHPNITKCYRKS